LIALRQHRPGDIGWIISRHGALYAAEYGWSMEFEALVAEIGARFLREFRPGLECCLIAERQGDDQGEPLGSIMVVRLDDDTAKLRLLLVEPAARGLGLGQRLVEAAEDFARQAGYRRMTLWTQSCLLAARRIYAARGWRLTESEAVRAFDADLVSETWEKALAESPPA
jgi:GNAT superfamily N-acetyltransferase